MRSVLRLMPSSAAARIWLPSVRASAASHFGQLVAWKTLTERTHGVAARYWLAEEEGRARIIILVTDGNETLSSATLADAIKGAQEAETTVYVVAIESKAFTPGPLKYLAKRTGGRYYGAPSPSALQGIYAELAAELKRTWRLDYVTSGRPGESPKLVAYVPGLGRDSARSPIAATAEVAKPGGLIAIATWGPRDQNDAAEVLGAVVALVPPPPPGTEGPFALLQRVLKIYRSIRPLFVVIAGLPILPSTWSAVIGMFVRALDALAGSDVNAEFKAGRDL